MASGAMKRIRFWLGRLIAVGPPLMGRLVNARLVAPVWLALIGFSIAGRFLDGLLVALGAYIVLFGAGQPGKRRFFTFVTCAGLLLVAITCGVLAAGHAGYLVVSYLGLTAVALIADIVFPLGPPGPYFFVLMVGGGTLLGSSGISLAHMLPLLALGSAAATVFSLADLLHDRYGAEKRAVAAAESAVQTLREAVTSLQDGSHQTSPIEVIDDQLAPAARGVHQAWTTLLAGGGSDERATRIEGHLRQVHAEYQSLYLTTMRYAHGHETDDPEAQGVAAATPKTVEDPRRTALGRPGLGHQLRTALHWPSPTLVTAARASAAVVAATLISGLVGDRHPFWIVLVVLLVLSHPGDQQSLTLRAVQRLLGTVAGVVVFGALMGFTLPPAALVALVCVLLWIVSRFAARNYLIGSFFITLLALYLVVPLSPHQTPGSLAANRLIDTGIGVALSITLIWLVGPSLTVPLTKSSIRRIADSSITVLSDLAEKRDTSDPAFVEHRRQLQQALMGNGTALQFGGSRTRTRAKPYRTLEQQCTRAGFMALGESWRPTRANPAEYATTRAQLHQIIQPALAGATPEKVQQASEHLDALLRPSV